LLLVVLSMLTLFLMLGAAYLVAATRAREAARAYARLTLGSDDARVPHAQLLDSVLLRVVRGPAITGTVGGATISFESLLADKYGATAVSGTASSVSGAGPIVTVNATLSGSLQPTDLNGRVLTFAAAGRQATSHRIIRAQAGTGPNSDPTNATATAFTLALDKPVTAGPFTMPAAGRIIINQREFIGDGSPGSPNEPWDGFDSVNPFLARAGTMTMSTSTVSRISYLPTLATTTLSGTWDYDSDGIPDAADNDNDGSWDGAFLDVGIPDMVDGNGNAVRLRASVLILDLDGRFNVNAHDSIARIAYSGTVLWSSTTGTSLPLGSGYGPAEVNGAKMFSTVSSTSTVENPALLVMVGGSTLRLTGTRGPGSRFTSGTLTPRLDVVEGRYGRDFPALTWPSVLPLTTGTTLFGLGYSLPGVSGTNDTTSTINDRRADPSQVSDFSYGVPTVWWTGGTAAFNWAASPSIAGAQPPPRGVFNSPPDLHGRMRTTTGAAAAIAPRLFFGKPEWSGASASFESTDDPYEINLDTRGGRGGWLHDPATSGVSGTASYVDNPFLLSELEPVLRPYDSDTNRLAMRLAAILGSFAEESRMKVTTDCWDTTAITGSAARAMYGGTAGGGWLQAASGALYGSTPTTGIIGGEVARGERFDLNRALSASGIGTAGYVPSGPYYTQRQAYFKDLYTLLVMLSSTGGSGPTALTPTGTVSGTAATAALAQYAANVVEFRDADSVMTPFEYDTNPSNGWDVDGDVRNNDAGSNERRVVFGAERPEILIQQAFAWRDSVSGSAGMVITLHRPWNARALTITPTTAAIDAEPCDYALDTLVSPTNSTIITGTAGVPNNLIDLGKKPHSLIMNGTANTEFNDNSQANYPIWRIRIVSGTEARYVRFDTNSPATGEFAPTITTGSSKPRLGSDSTLTLASGTTITLSATSVTGTVTGTAFLNVTSTTITGMRVPGTSGTATISLERLSDPSQQPGNTVWATGTADPRLNIGITTEPLQYVVIDSCTVPVVETSAAGLTPPTITTGSACMRSTTSATAAFWATGTWAPIGTITSSGTLSLPTSLGGVNNTVWFPWPNRPLVGSPELLLVPRFDSLGMLQNYQRPTPANQSAVGIPVPANLLFDAVHVPTRFAGIHRTYTTDFSAATGIFNSGTVTTPVNQLSSFREPGRVNLNTVGSDDVWDAVVNGPLSGTIASRNSVNLVSTPAGSMVKLLALSSSGTTVASDTDSALATGTSLNPMHAIYTATRLANTVTPRSNVFAIWITLRESTANDPDSVRYRRAFYIIDRSIPVGYEEGRDHNVRDAIRLRRIIE
jgi:hypothetical protein